jgi:hypothetical protein
VAQETQDDFDVAFAQIKRKRRFRALRDDGALFGLTDEEQAEFDTLRAEFDPEEKG